MTQWRAADIISAGSAVIAALALCFGVWQYWQSENWKRSEFVSKQIADFYADRANQIIVQIIEYDDAMVELIPGKPRVKVTGEMFQKSIEEKGEPTDAEAEIQQDFLHYLKSLARLNYFLKTDAIRPNELCADFGFSVAVMTGDAGEMVKKNSNIDIASFAKAVGEYLDRWHHPEAKQFLTIIKKTCK
ncbi:MAG TPA: hypothetical protein VNZ53_04110 [Steroidobacteraceae bacterium]|jgi:hypothetical protein|nr:hypothetical protein [Steroidobacteraceae bacterium]